jgi:hypothetical protein
VTLWTAGPRAELSGWLMEAVTAGGTDPTVKLSRWLVGARAEGLATRTEPPGKELAGAGAWWALATGT